MQTVFIRINSWNWDRFAFVEHNEFKRFSSISIQIDLIMDFLTQQPIDETNRATVSI